MPRPTLGRIEWKVSIPKELALNIELLLYDKTSKRSVYGARSLLITQLLQSHWDNLPLDKKLEARTPGGNR